MVSEMKNCKNCKIKVSSNDDICPLCKTVLTGSEEGKQTYPKITINKSKYNLIIRIYLFLSIVGIVCTAVVNYLTYNGFMWSIISTAALLYFWSIISHAIKNNVNIAYKILIQTICISILSVVIDIVIGYTGWSVNYVVPGLTTTANVTVLILIIINRMNWKNYILYQISIIALGFIPIILIFCNIIYELWYSVISVGIAFIILCGTIIFSDNDVKGELKRRLHF